MLVLNSKRRKLIIVVFSALVLLISVFIFVNSSMDYEASHSSSGAIADIIRPGESLADREQTEFTIRKLAHLVEYFVLGASVTALCISVDRFYGRKFYGCALFYSLLVAVLDEYIQSFTGRGSTVPDILLDLVGITLGFLLTLAAFYIAVFIKKKLK